MLLALLLLLVACAAAMTSDEARAELQLPRRYSEKELKSAYRKRSVETHPDKGGSTEQFLRVSVLRGVRAAVLSLTGLVCACVFYCNLYEVMWVMHGLGAHGSASRRGYPSASSVAPFVARASRVRPTAQQSLLKFPFLLAPLQTRLPSHHRQLHPPPAQPPLTAGAAARLPPASPAAAFRGVGCAPWP